MEAKMDATIREILEGYFGEGSVEDVIDDLHRQIYKAGIKEVVEYCEQCKLTFHHYPNTQIPLLKGTIVITPENWQAKLKEWGVE